MSFNTTRNASEATLFDPEAQRQPAPKPSAEPYVVPSASNSTNFTPQTTISEKASKEPEKKSRWAMFSLKPDSAMLYDAILGLSDGLTVPFALTAGLASVGTTRIVIMGGLAELVAGMISMGIGGFIGSRSEAEQYRATLKKCRKMISDTPWEVREIVDKHFEQYSVAPSDRVRIVDSLIANQEALEEFLMTQHYEETEPDSSRPFKSAVVLGLAYFLGGFIALVPYLIVKQNQVYTALYISIGVMAFVMFAFGWVKTGVVSGWRGKENILACLRGAVEMLVVGAAAVGAAVGLARAIERGYGGESCVSGS